MKMKSKFARLFARILPGRAVAWLMRGGVIGPGTFAFCIREQSRQLSSVMRAAKLRQGLTVNADGELYVLSDGISLSAAGTNRYLKVVDKDSGNQGTAMAEFLEHAKVTPRTIVDLGANFGEISLYFAKRYPSSRVVAVEASSENLAILKGNIEAQAFSTAGIEVIHAAVADQNGMVSIGRGRGADNSILAEYQRRGPDNIPLAEDVRAMSLVSIFEQLNLATVDFMKIDIEGAEPLLLDGICELSDRIQALLIEFGSKNTADNYSPFLHRLAALGFEIYAEGSLVPFADASAAEAHHRITRQSGVGEDFWFVRKVT